MARRFAFACPFLLLLAASPALADPCVEAAEGQHDLKTANKLVAAKKKLQVCAQLSCGERIAATCTKWLAEVEAFLPTVVVQALDASGKETTRVKVTLDGETVATALDGTALALDPGTHHFRFDREGGGTVDQDVVIRIGEKNRKLLVTFPPTSPAFISPALPPPAASPNRVPAIVAFAFGAAGLGVGAVTGVLALDQKARLDDMCPTKTTCPESERGTKSTAGTMSIVSTVAIPAGAVGVGVGVLLWVTASSKKLPPRAGSFYIAPSFDPSRLGVEGTF